MLAFAALTSCLSDILGCLLLAYVLGSFASLVRCRSVYMSVQTLARMLLRKSKIRQPVKKVTSDGAQSAPLFGSPFPPAFNVDERLIGSSRTASF